MAIGRPSPIKISGILAFCVLWLTHLVSLLLSAEQWVIRRWSKGLVVNLVVQVVLAVMGLLALLPPDDFFRCSLLARAIETGQTLRGEVGTQ